MHCCRKTTLSALSATWWVFSMVAWYCHDTVFGGTIWFTCSYSVQLQNMITAVLGKLFGTKLWVSLDSQKNIILNNKIRSPKRSGQSSPHSFTQSCFKRQQRIFLSWSFSKEEIQCVAVILVLSELTVKLKLHSRMQVDIWGLGWFEQLITKIIEFKQLNLTWWFAWSYVI